MRNLFVAIFAPLLVVTPIALIITAAVNVHDKNETLKSNIGETVIIDNDTLTIVGYSLWNEEYGLSNGLTISDEYAEKHIIK